MTVRFRSVVVLHTALVSVLILCAQSPSQSSSSPAAIVDEGAGSSSSNPGNRSTIGVAGFAGIAAFAPGIAGASVAAPAIPSAPEPAAGGGRDSWEVTPAGTAHQQPFSRIGIGANVSPLGIGINGTTVLSDFFDARLMGNFFSYTSPQFEIDSIQATANVHLASMAASLDWYPLNSIFRISPGLMFYNGNRVSMTALIVPGSSFTLNGQTFYSTIANAATGATPLAGSGVLGLHTHEPAFTLAGGFGKFVPRSNRHWSFPAEFGVVFMGAPTINVSTQGWVCTDQAQTQCSNVSNAANPVAQSFNTQLQAQVTKWRHSAANIGVYPIFSYSFVYSFNIRQ